MTKPFMLSARLAAASALLALGAACSTPTSDDPPSADGDPSVDAGRSMGGSVAPMGGSGAGGADRDASEGPPVVVNPPGTGRDAGPDAAAPPEDAGHDAGHDAGFDAGHDAGDPDPPPPTGTALGHLEVLSGAGTGQGSVAGHRLRLRIGFAGVRGAGTSTGYRLRLGSRR